MFGVQQMAKYVGLSPNTVRKRANVGSIGKYVGKTLVFVDEDIDKIMSLAPKMGRPYTGKSIQLDTALRYIRNCESTYLLIIDLIGNCVDSQSLKCPPDCGHFDLCSKFVTTLQQKNA